MNVKSGKRFCGEHANFDKEDVTIEENNAARMPCPFDPNHSCYVSQLDKHLKKCNSKPQPQPDYIQKDTNVFDSSAEDEIKIALVSLSDEELLKFIEKVSDVHQAHVGKLTLSAGHHQVLEPILTSLKESRGSWRHVNQNSSILYNMEQSGLLKKGEGSTYVEFGSGRGQLSYYIGQAINLETESLLMIDKSSPRHKSENRFKVDGVNKSSIHRLRADIADVDLNLVPCVQSTKAIIAVGKHLCGAATDMALHSLHKVSDKMKEPIVKGVCIALCCHHQCTWRHYVGRAFLTEMGFSRRDFAILRALTSWATCGARDNPLVGKEEHDAPIKDDAAIPRYVAMGLDADYREEVGRQCKQIIDYGRVKYLSSWSSSPSLSTRLLYYVEKDMSLENVLLLSSVLEEQD